MGEFLERTDHEGIHRTVPVVETDFPNAGVHLGVK